MPLVTLVRCWRTRDTDTDTDTEHGARDIRVERESSAWGGRRVDKGVADIDVIAIQRVNPARASGQRKFLCSKAQVSFGYTVDESRVGRELVTNVDGVTK